MMLYSACHTSSLPVKKFDIEKFRENCLDIDTKQFGIYFYFLNPNSDHFESIFQELMRNCARYGLRFGAKTGYMHLCTVDIDEERMIDTFSKIDYEEFTYLYKVFNLPLSQLENIYQKAKDNRAIFFMLIKNLKNYLKWDWSKISHYLIAKGYDGYKDGNDFGTLVIFNTELIKVNTIIEYTDSNDFRPQNIHKLNFVAA